MPNPEEIATATAARITAQAPADAVTLRALTADDVRTNAADDGGEDAGEKPDADDVNQELDAGESDDKGEKKADDKKPAAEKKTEKKGATDKVEKKPDDKKPAKKTLIGGAKEAGAKDDAAGDKKAGKDGADKDAADELATWKPKLPAGQEADAELLGELVKAGRENGWKPAQLQGVVDLGVKMQQKAAQALVAAHEAKVEGYEKAARADPEIGGAKLEAAAASCADVVNRFAGKNAPAVLEALEESGLGSHPEVIRFLAAVDKATREDDTVPRTRGKTGAPSKDDPMGRFTQRMYPKMNRELAKQRGEDVEDDG